MSNTKKRNLSLKQKPIPEPQQFEVQELQTLTLAELEVIAGGVLSSNHNETVVQIPNLSQKPKPSSEEQPEKVQELQKLTLNELELCAGATSCFAEAEAIAQ